MPRADLISFRQGTESAWLSADPVLASGEPGYITDTNEIVYGDGVTAFSGLTRHGAGSDGLTSVELGLDLDPHNVLDDYRWVRVHKSLFRPTVGAWDELTTEWPNVVRFRETLWAFYHGKTSSTPYSIGCASIDLTTEGPFGEWTKDSSNPILTGGAVGDWDEGPIAHPTCLHLLDGTFALTYWDGGAMGVAVSDSPNGTYVKSTANPVLNPPGGGWGGSVFAKDGYFYVVAPTSQGEDFPDGWRLYRTAITTGTVADLETGWSEVGEITLLGSGMRVNEARYYTLRSIMTIGGQVYGFGTLRDSIAPPESTDSERTQNIVAFRARGSDMLTWEPIATSPLVIGTDTDKFGTNGGRRTPDAAAYEHPFPLMTPDEGLVLFANSRTTRDMSAWVGVPPHKPLNVYVARYAEITSLVGSANTGPDDTKPINLRHVHRLAVTILPTFDLAAANGIEVGLYLSSNGVDFDTDPVASTSVAAGSAQQTWIVDVPSGGFGQLRVSNLDTVAISVRLDYRMMD